MLQEPAQRELDELAKQATTKGELLTTLKAHYKNTMNLVTALLHDDDLRKDLKQIQVGAGPIHAEYKNFLQNQKNGKDLHFCELMQFGPYHPCFLDDLTGPSPHS